MSETVFILGAGASKEAGAPLIADFLDKARQLHNANKVHDFRADFDLVFRAISGLQAVHSKSELDLNNIESVFAAFEMGQIINKLPGMSEKDRKHLLGAIKRVISATLEKTMTYRVKGEGILSDEAYKSFALLVNDLNQGGTQNRCSIITFNYDLALDYALWTVGHSANYHLEESVQPGYTTLLKLHGSLNWGRCCKCKAIVPWGFDDFFKKVGRFRLKGKQSTHLMLASSLRDYGPKHCEKPVGPDPVIVPPTWNKTQHHQDLSQVWGRAALELGEATNIFVSGYSLTETDSFFRYLYALGSVGKTLIERFWVFDPDDSGEVRERFEKLVGLAAKRRFRYEEKTFAEAIGVIRKELAVEKR